MRKATDKEIAEHEMRKAWVDYWNSSKYLQAGEQDAFNAGWNAALDMAARFYIQGDGLKELKAEVA